MKNQSLIDMKAIHYIVFTSLLLAWPLVLTSQVTLAKTDVKCSGEKNGKVTVTSIANAKYPIKEYHWNNGESGPTKKTISKLPGGTYRVTVTDANDCTATASIVVNEPESKLGLSISSSSGEFYLCGPSSVIITATPTGGTPPYSTNGSNGSYTVTVSLSNFGDGPKYLDFETTDGNGCSKKQRQFFAFSAITCASDPNDITGPVGFADPRWVSSKRPMDYTIRFENDPELATSPAQVVRVVLPVDPKINPFSLRLGDFGWGPYSFSVPENSTFYQTRLDLVDSLGLFVDVTAGFDINDQEFFWLFESIDPETGQLPLDPQLGFLPVNDTMTGSGEGFIHFSMTPKNNAVTGDTVQAQAEIIFDINESIFTNTWKNKLDAVAPVSNLNMLEDSTENNEIVLSWTAEDDPGGAGVGDYELFVSIDDGPLTLVANEITDTSFIYTSQPGFTYAFMVLATDKTGNREALKQAPEDTVYIIPIRTIDLLTPSGNDLCLYDSLTISWLKLTTDSVHLEMSVDSGYSYFTLTPSIAVDSFVLFLHDTLLSDEVFFRLTDLDDDSVVVVSQPLVIHTLPEVDAGDDIDLCIGDITYLAATGANSYVWDSTATLNLLDVYNPRVTTMEEEMFYVTGTDVFSCQNKDSVFVDILPIYLDSIIYEMCNEDSVFVGGGYQTEPGFYVDSLAASTGCDSTVVTEVILTGPCPFPADQVYVDQDAVGLNNGTSWANAFTDLQDALEAVEYYVDVTSIWVADGQYYPSVPAGRNASFTLRDSVKVYGGFLGIENNLTERTGDETIVKLTGDLGTPMDSTDNAYHVIRIDSSCVDCIIDRLTIQFGHGDGVGEETFGAGLYVEGKATLDQVTVERNTTEVEGSAIFNTGMGTLLILRDCLFRLNTSSLARDILNSNGAEIQFEGLNTIQE